MFLINEITLDSINSCQTLLPGPKISSDFAQFVKERVILGKILLLRNVILIRPALVPKIFSVSLRDSVGFRYLIKRA